MNTDTFFTEENALLLDVRTDDRVTHTFEHVTNFVQTDKCVGFEHQGSAIYFNLDHVVWMNTRFEDVKERP